MELRKLDVMVAARILGCKVQNRDTAAPNCGCPAEDEYGNQPHASTRMSDDRHLKFYSSEIEAAWEVWLKTIELHKADKKNCSTNEPFDYQYVPTILELEGQFGVDFVYNNYDCYPEPDFYGTLPHAICLAALKVVGVSV